jgi:hypothetical protein
MKPARSPHETGCLPVARHRARGPATRDATQQSALTTLIGPRELWLRGCHAPGRRVGVRVRGVTARDVRTRDATAQLVATTRIGPRDL